MKRKLVTIMLSMGLILSLCACGSIKNGTITINGQEYELAPVEDDEDVEDQENNDKENNKENNKEIPNKEVEEDKNVEIQEENKEEEKVTETTPATTPSELSDDIYSFQVSIDGTIYQFPMWAKDFAALGWIYDGDDNQTLTSNQYTVAETWTKGDLEVYTSLINLSMNEVTYKDAAVGGITLDQFYLKDTNVQIELPKGIQFCISTRDDIIAAYGTPSDEYDGDLYYKMTYKQDYYQEIALYVYKESGILEKIEIRNFIELEGADNSVNPTVPDVVKEYKAPSDLGDNLYDFNIQLEGKLYTFPCPVSEFIANGFKINEKNSQMEIGADSYGWIELSYNNQTYRCIVDNYANYATIAENCFVTTMESSIYGPNFNLIIPGNIKIGDTETDLLAIIKDFNYEKETSGDFTYYEISDPNSDSFSDYDITVKDGKIIVIDVEFDN